MAARRNNDDPSDFVDPQSLLNAFSRLDPRAQIVIVILLVIAGIVFYVAYQKTRQPGTSPTTVALSPQMLLGNPSNATADGSNADNYLMVKPYFALSYNSSKGTPNWVSWRVTASDLGHAPRKPNFDPDTTLPMGLQPNYHQSVRWLRLRSRAYVSAQ